MAGVGLNNELHFFGIGPETPVIIGNLHTAKVLYSLRLAVETNNAGAWDCVPRRCMGFVERYIRGVRYLRDSKVIAKFSSDFVKSVLPLVGDVRDASLVFDIAETLLCNADLFFNMANSVSGVVGSCVSAAVNVERERASKEQAFRMNREQEGKSDSFRFSSNTWIFLEASNLVPNSCCILLFKASMINKTFP
ncbi:hypothetical protein JHK87_018255 [Glycine soja]|nr:hypothetical protein JHK87_018255 [Glycine soja]